MNYTSPHFLFLFFRFLTSSIGKTTTTLYNKQNYYTLYSWTWNWCEPALGTVSFVLLALQFARAQIQNLGYRPYTQFIKQRRAEQLASLYPQYDASLLINFSKSSSLVAANRLGSTVKND